ncbi:hypothetical protein ACFJGW_14670 [Burkholderiaceae bacterium UC74_6]
MRAALSILGLVIVLAIVLLNAKNQMKSLAPVPASSAASGIDPVPAPNRATPDAVRAQVQSSLDQAASAASAAQP